MLLEFLLTYWVLSLCIGGFVGLLVLALIRYSMEIKQPTYKYRR